MYVMYACTGILLPIHPSQSLLEPNLRCNAKGEKERSLSSRKEETLGELSLMKERNNSRSLVGTVETDLERFVSPGDAKVLFNCALSSGLVEPAEPKVRNLILTQLTPDGLPVRLQVVNRGGCIAKVRAIGGPPGLTNDKWLAFGFAAGIGDGISEDLGGTVDTCALPVWECIHDDHITSINNSLIGRVNPCSPRIR